MKKVLLITAAVLTLAWGRTVMACSTDAECNPNPGDTNHCGCAQGTAPGAPSGTSACGELDILGSFGGPTVLEVSGCADASGNAPNGCVTVGEVVDLSGAGPGECDSAADAACVACGCGACVPNGNE